MVRCRHLFSSPRKSQRRQVPAILLLIVLLLLLTALSLLNMQPWAHTRDQLLWKLRSAGVMVWNRYHEKVASLREEVASCVCVCVCVMKRSWQECVAPDDDLNRSPDNPSAIDVPISKRINRLSLDSAQSVSDVSADVTLVNVSGASYSQSQSSSASQHLPINGDSFVPVSNTFPPHHQQQHQHQQQQQQHHQLQHHHQQQHHQQQQQQHHQQQQQQESLTAGGHSLPPRPDMMPADSPHYYAINCQLYRLHLERLKRRH